MTILKFLSFQSDQHRLTKQKQKVVFFRSEKEITFFEDVFILDFFPTSDVSSFPVLNVLTRNNPMPKPKQKSKK
jgi:hypothetical protein